MANHALLSASTAARWIKCPPSARLCATMADKPSEYATQGTDAHVLCEYKLRKLLGEKVRKPKLSFYDAEMEEACETYALFVDGLIKSVPDAFVLVEQRVDFSDYVPEGFGTADALIISDKEMFVIDFKYGQGVEVSADHNPQMLCYALGCMQMFGDLYDIDKITAIIFQPRLANLSEFEITQQELLDWANNTLVSAAKLAYNGEGEFCAGEHCRFCKAKANCRKRAEYNLALAKYDFAVPSILETKEIAAILPRLDEFAQWATDVKDYALEQALGGVKFDGFKVVEGRSNRRYTDENAVAKTVEKAGYTPYEKKLLGITAMTKMLGKTKFESLLGQYIEKPPGKPTLVPDSDKRPPFNKAAEDFKEEN